MLDARDSEEPPIAMAQDCWVIRVTSAQRVMDSGIMPRKTGWCITGIWRHMSHIGGFQETVKELLNIRMNSSGNLAVYLFLDI